MYLVTDEISGFNKHRKVAFVSTFDFSTLYTKLLYNKLLMTLNSLIDFCLNVGESKYITVNSYGVHWVKNIKDNAIYHKQLFIFFLIVISLLVLRYFSARLLVFLWDLIRLLYLPTLSYIFMKVSDE